MSDYLPPESDAYDDGEDEGSSRDSSTIQEMRKALKSWERKAKELEKEVAPLREFQQQITTERRATAVTSAFTEAGLNPSHAKLFNALHGETSIDEINAETVTKFAAEYDLPLVTGEVAPKVEDKPRGYNPVTTGSAPSKGMLTIDDIKALEREGRFEEVNNAYKDGRVLKEENPWPKARGRRP